MERLGDFGREKEGRLREFHSALCWVGKGLGAKKEETLGFPDSFGQEKRQFEEFWG